MSADCPRLVPALVFVVGLLVIGAASSAEPSPQKKPRLDRSGDPLPSQVLARLDTARPRGVSFLTLTPDGRHVLTRSADGFIFIYEARSGRLLRRVPVPLVGREFIEHVLPEGRLLTVDPDQSLVGLRNLLTGEIDRCFAAVRPDFGPPVSVPAPGQRYVAVHHRELGPFARDCSVTVFDLRTGKVKYRLDADQARQGLKISADGDVLAWCNRVNGKAWHSQQDGQANIRVYNRASEKTLALPNLQTADHRFLVDRFKFHPCLSPDGRWIVLPTRKGTMRRWDVKTATELPPLAEPLHGGGEMHWSPDRRLLAMCGSARPIEQQGFDIAWEWGFWDAVNGVRLKHLKLTDSGSCICFSSDGRTLLSGDSQGVIHLWETATGKERAALAGHPSGGITRLSLSADGRILVSCGGESQIWVWDLTGHLLDGQWQRARLSPEQRRSAWEMLGTTDAEAAYRALWQLTADPGKSIAFLREHMQPVDLPAPGQVAKLIAELDSPAFAVRVHAQHELERFGQTILADLRKPLTQKPSLELRRRLEMLIEKLEGLPQDRELQMLRGLEVLEQIGTPEAVTLLQKMAAGAAGARLTESARHTLSRCRVKKTP